MPSSVGHSLLGFSIYLIFNKKINLRQNWKIILLYIFCANIPDLDLLPGALKGDINKYHHGITHTLGFSIFLALIVALVLKIKKSNKILFPFLLTFLLPFSHIALDLFAQDTRSPYGVMLLWPFTNQYFVSFPLFLQILRGPSWLSIFNSANVGALLRELIIFLPIIGILYFFRKSKREF
jgi:inner membrane protein